VLRPSSIERYRLHNDAGVDMRQTELIAVSPVRTGRAVGG